MVGRDAKNEHPSKGRNSIFESAIDHQADNHEPNNFEWVQVLGVRTKGVSYSVHHSEQDIKINAELEAEDENDSRYEGYENLRNHYCTRILLGRSRLKGSEM